MTATTTWWAANYPARYYAFSSSATLGGYPVAGLADLNVYSAKPSWLTESTALVALTKDQWLSITPCNLIIKDGAVQTYVAPVETAATADTSTSTSTSTSSTAS